jgi:hypothetical protein
MFALLASATIADGVCDSYMQYMMRIEGQEAFSSEFDKIHGGRPFGRSLHESCTVTNRVHGVP